MEIPCMVGLKFPDLFHGFVNLVLYLTIFLWFVRMAFLYNLVYCFHQHFISSVQAQQKKFHHDIFCWRWFAKFRSSKLEDSKGYIWIATDRGVSKFDGYEIKSFGIAEGLLDISILRLTLDSRGRVWMIGRSEIFIMKREGKILPYKFTKTVVDFCQQAVPIDFQIDSNGTFYVSFTYSGVLAIDSSGHTKRIISYHDVTQQTRYLDLYEISPGKLMKSVSNFRPFHGRISYAIHTTMFLTLLISAH